MRDGLGPLGLIDICCAELLVSDRKLGFGVADKLDRIQGYVAQAQSERDQLRAEVERLREELLRAQWHVRELGGLTSPAQQLSPSESEAPRPSHEEAPATGHPGSDNANREKLQALFDNLADRTANDPELLPLLVELYWALEGQR